MFTLRKIFVKSNERERNNLPEVTYFEFFRMKEVNEEYPKMAFIKNLNFQKPKL